MFIFNAFSSFFPNPFAIRAPEKHRRGKPLESVIQLKMSACLPPPPATTTSEAPTTADQRVNRGEEDRERERRGGMVVFDPRGRQRWKECVVQPVNTLTQRGEKLPTSSFPTIPKLTSYTWRKGEWRRSEADGEEGIKIAQR